MVTTGEPHVERAAFDSAVGTTFVVGGDDAGGDAAFGNSATLTLIEVRAVPAAAGWERFSLLFDGADQGVLTQATYWARHDAIGAFPVFLGPVHAGEGQVLYEAVFNRRASVGVND